MWYKDDDSNLDFSKPIFATDESGNIIHILLPVRDNVSYQTIGYDWFNIKVGEWNSKMQWKNPQNAVDAYNSNYEIFNGELDIIR